MLILLRLDIRIIDIKSSREVFETEEILRKNKGEIHTWITRKPE